MYKSRTDFTTSLKIEFEHRSFRIVLVSSSDRGHLPAVPFTIEEETATSKKVLLSNRSIYHSSIGDGFLDPGFDTGFFITVHCNLYPQFLGGHTRSKFLFTQDHIWHYCRSGIKSGRAWLNLRLMENMTPYRREFDDHIAKAYDYFSTK